MKSSTSNIKNASNNHNNYSSSSDGIGQPRRNSAATTNGGGAAAATGKKGRVSLETARRDSVGKEYLYKVLVVGCAATGKTSLIHRTVEGHFSGQYKSTIGVDFALKSLERDQHKIFVQLWDIAGQERFSSLTRVYYRDAVGAFVVIDATADLKTSLESAKKWKDDVDDKVKLPNGEHLPVVLIANKSDLLGNIHNINESEIDEFAKANKFAGWLATSAKENINVEEAVGALVDKILQNAERNCLLERSQGPSLDERVRSLELYRELHGNDSGGCC
ncbi:Ras subfamily protein [Acanthamoeba castellanii str. Neff]|uniref:Ras subfamily protein n=1 Tax=Acanthamoeba castellanii (strain ATCC 30010 / Neff) TaxID=1257118 RepID=L8H6Y7_ACACF|nr:Ras subfamily protein [Acanthamoeba castellanii str. Neff]ELR21284.1 Ras subfamily protein [Acanthamoeba castellanii str. Neff]